MVAGEYRRLRRGKREITVYTRDRQGWGGFDGPGENFRRFVPGWLKGASPFTTASEEAKQFLDALRPFEQAIINEYLPGQGIAPHIDRDCFGPIVATVSLGSAVNMDFCRDSTGDEYVQRLVPRSLVLLYGDARFKWRHGIAKRHYDMWNGHKTKRHRRVSITFRTIADVG